MIGLFPIRLISVGALALFAFVASMLLGAWFESVGELTKTARSLVAYASTAFLIFSCIILLGWRWVPFFQRLTFPYLGGRWGGHVRFPEGDSEDTRPVTLEVSHTPLNLTLLLESKESESRTLAVQVVRDPIFERYRLFYVYLNTRKEGVIGAGSTYRGLAIIQVEVGPQMKLVGTYFTDKDRRGILELTEIELHPWWKIWR